MENTEDTIKLHVNKEKPIINNNSLNEYLKFKLDKNNYTKEDLKNIHEIILDSKNIVGDYNPVYFNEIDLFPNLNSISIKNLGVSSDDMNKLKDIKKIEFINCELEDLSVLREVQTIILNNTKIEKIESLELLENIKELQLINIDFNNYDILKKLEKLEKLSIKNVPDFSFSKIDFPLNIKSLSVYSIPNLDLNVIKQYKCLEELSMDAEELQTWKNELEKLKSDGINILINDIYSF